MMSEMKIITYYHAYKDRWWALPLVLPFVLYPLASKLSFFSSLNGNELIVYYLNMGLLSALTMIYGVTALPGITLFILEHITPHRGLAGALLSMLHFLASCGVCGFIYYRLTGKRGRVGFGEPALGLRRWLWLFFVNSALFFLFYHVEAWLGALGPQTAIRYASPFVPETLLDFQGILIGNITGIPLFYLIIRIIRSPKHVIKHLNSIRYQSAANITRAEVFCWIFSALAVMTVIVWPDKTEGSIFNSTYTLTLLLPVLLWGVLRFGYAATSLLWWPMLIGIFHWHEHFIPRDQNYRLHLTIASSTCLMFSITVIMVAVNITRQRNLHRKTKRLLNMEPVFQLLNLQALHADLSKHPQSVVCQLFTPDMEMLGRHYGLRMTVIYYQELTRYLSASLNVDERVYKGIGHSLIIRLNPQESPARIEALYQLAKDFRFLHDGMLIQSQMGCSYCAISPPICYLDLLLGELSELAETSLSTQQAEDLGQRSHNTVQAQVEAKVQMVGLLQRALEQDRFLLVAQPIENAAGIRYYEILLRMRDDNGGLVFPDAFFPLAGEFGMSSQIDLWVLCSTMKFMHDNRHHRPDMRFAINLTPASICRADMADQIGRLLAKYQVCPTQIVFEVTETSELVNVDQADRTLAALREMGCQIAIDDFGSGYASYARLKEMNADILKIDGSFIRNIAANHMDRNIVSSVCELARLKNMTLVAEFVETDDIRQILYDLGIEYMQGYLIGKPESLEQILA